MPAMLRYALRRILWAIPTLLATSLVLFLVTTLAPEPTAPDYPLIDEAWRSRFLDLPRFVNAHPEDVRSRSAEALAHVAAADPQQETAARQLAWRGGGGWRPVLPAFEALAPDARGRVALALVPIAERMGLTGDQDLSTPEA